MGLQKEIIIFKIFLPGFVFIKKAFAQLEPANGKRPWKECACL